MKPFSKKFLAVLILSGIVGAAQALGLGEAKANGWLGEQQDGYLGLVSGSAPAAARSLRDSINSQRRAEYQKIARRNNISVDEVAHLTAKKVISRAAAGQYVQDASGNWQKR